MHILGGEGNLDYSMDPGLYSEAQGIQKHLYQDTCTPGVQKPNYNLQPPAIGKDKMKIYVQT